MDDAVKAFHTLSPEELSLAGTINLNALQAKARAYDLRQQLQQAEAEIEKAQHHLSGFISALGQTHGIQNPVLSGDLKRIIRGNQQ